MCNCCGMSDKEKEEWEEALSKNKEEEVVGEVKATRKKSLFRR